ncbi:MAG TPA: endo-1,4-beta-xylanase [Lacipirellulaceae bacterium]|jgi:endo-1,4-beta-xylanase|nr:endo-1,4-beta-xylanase [Lacipirellulaceae bacterium]
MRVLRQFTCSKIFSLVLLAASSYAADPVTLKDAFKKEFLVGVAIGTHQIMGDEPASLELVARQFDAISPENLLKWQEVHPQPDQFNFDPADRYVEFGERHRMFILGHNLAWHNQTPAWVFEGESGKPIDRNELLERLHKHIQAVVGRYKGRINGWDVVNEAIEDNGSLRKTKWQQIVGDDYLEKAFQFAHEADPKAELYYNDYNEWQPEKRRGIKQLVRGLQAKHVQIDGLGLQGHWGLNYPSAAEIETMFEDYGDLGIKLMITELDVSVVPDAGQSRGADITRNETLRKELDPYPNGLPPDVQEKLAKRYAEIFRIFVKHADRLKRVTFWGVHDGHSWRNDWPVKGRHDYPLLFDRDLKPKPAFEAVIETATNPQH